MASVRDGADDVAALSSLDDPVRRRLYDFVAARSEPAGRDEAAAAVAISRSLAAYHLDKLVDTGLLSAGYQRPPGRGGPGAGRPAKVYTRSEREFEVRVPPREYELAADLLAGAVEGDPAGGSRTALHEVAQRFGDVIGKRSRAGAGRDTGSQDAIEEILGQYGFEPVRGADGVTRLLNCPFHQLAVRHRDLVCGMNLALVEGLCGGVDVGDLRPVLAPEPGHCCVVIGPSAASAPATAPTAAPARSGRGSPDRPGYESSDRHSGTAGPAGDGS
jgi:predicted ArsR family transcriptional regulator